MFVLYLHTTISNAGGSRIEGADLVRVESSQGASEARATADSAWSREWGYGVDVKAVNWKTSAAAASPIAGGSTLSRRILIMRRQVYP